MADEGAWKSKDENLGKVQSLGFTLEDSQRGLERGDGTVTGAIEWILQQERGGRDDEGPLRSPLRSASEGEVDEEPGTADASANCYSAAEKKPAARAEMPSGEGKFARKMANSDKTGPIGSTPSPLDADPSPRTTAEMALGGGPDFYVGASAEPKIPVWLKGSAPTATMEKGQGTAKKHPNMRRDLSSLPSKTATGEKARATVELHSSIDAGPSPGAAVEMVTGGGADLALPGGTSLGTGSIRHGFPIAADSHGGLTTMAAGGTLRPSHGAQREEGRVIPDQDQSPTDAAAGIIDAGDDTASATAAADDATDSRSAPLIQGYQVPEHQHRRGSAGAGAGGAEDRVRRLLVANTLVVQGEAVPGPGEGNKVGVGIGNICCSLLAGRWPNRCIALSLLALVVVVAAVLAAVLTTTSRGSEGNASTTQTGPTLPDIPVLELPPRETDAPTTYREFVVKGIVERISSPEVLRNESSHQFRAFQWLLYEDKRVFDPLDSLAVVQRYVLALVYFATNGDESWTDKLDFLSPVSECDWNIVQDDFSYQGVVCFTGDVVTGLYLGSNNLTGSLPEEVFSIPKLENLNLQQNGELSGTLPARIGDAALLETLYLRYTKLSESIPSSIGQLSKLSVLVLSANALTGSIPSSMGNAVKLQALSLSGNALNDTIPPSLGNLMKLKELYLNHNSLSGTIPSALTTIATLSSINLGHNNLHGVIPSYAWDCEELTSFYVADNQLNGSIPSSIYACPKLEDLFLYNNTLTGSLLPAVGNLLQLQILAFASNTLTGKIPSEITLLTDLRQLSLSSNLLEGIIPASIGNLHNLHTFMLFNNSLSGTIPPSFAELSSLDTVDFALNGLSGTLPSFIGGLTTLTDLRLEYNRFFLTIPRTFDDLTSLYRLGLHGNKLTGDISFLCDTVTVMWANCMGPEPEVICPCCQICCQGDAFGDNCEYPD